jgi:hypothetical protein
VHAERLVHELETSTEPQGRAQQHVRRLIWWSYADLKTYRLDPTPHRRCELEARFDRNLQRQTGFATLDRPLRRLHPNKTELLIVLDHPEVPLHTNGSENDMPCQVNKRHVSGGTRSDAGRDCRNAFLRARQDLPQARHCLLGLTRRQDRRLRRARNTAGRQPHPLQQPARLTCGRLCPSCLWDRSRPWCLRGQITLC